MRPTEPVAVAVADVDFVWDPLVVLLPEEEGVVDVEGSGRGMLRLLGGRGC